jgi:ABC-type glycerol-3-phosphate transport system substrate-binding protein
MAACAPTAGNSIQSIVTLTTVPSVTAPALPTATAPESTPEGPMTLSVWWPEPLGPVNNDDASLLLSDQVDNFQSSQTDVQIEIRLKKPEDVGGILETMRAARLVAPDAMPDLTLFRREDLLQAVNDKLVQPLAAASLSAIRSDLYPAVLELGLVNRQLYGVPYALDIEHIAYKPLVMSGTFTHFTDVLNGNQKFVFPAGITGASNNMLLLQYLSAGGTLTQLDASKLDPNALQTVYSFYQNALAKGVIDASVLNYTDPDEYQSALIEGQINAALVTSNQYLDLQKRGQSLAAAPLPLATGVSTTVVNGWMWVVVTKDARRQAAALRFVEWMLDIERQTTYTQSVNALPSRRSAMQQWDGEDYRKFANDLLLNARVPIVLEDNAVILQAMQSALAEVLSGQRTADEAVQDVINQVGK